MPVTINGIPATTRAVSEGEFFFIILNFLRAADSVVRRSPFRLSLNRASPREWTRPDAVFRGRPARDFAVGRRFCPPRSRPPLSVLLQPVQRFLSEGF